MPKHIEEHERAQNCYIILFFFFSCCCCVLCHFYRCTQVHMHHTQIFTCIHFVCVFFFAFPATVSYFACIRVQILVLFYAFFFYSALLLLLCFSCAHPNVVSIIFIRSDKWFILVSRWHSMLEYFEPLTKYRCQIIY